MKKLKKLDKICRSNSLNYSFDYSDSIDYSIEIRRFGNKKLLVYIDGSTNPSKLIKKAIKELKNEHEITH